MLNVNRTWSWTDWHKGNDSASFVVSDKCCWHDISTWQHDLTSLSPFYHLIPKIMFIVSHLQIVSWVGHWLLSLLHRVIEMVTVYKVRDVGIQVFWKIHNWLYSWLLSILMSHTTWIVVYIVSIITIVWPLLRIHHRDCRIAPNHINNHCSHYNKHNIGFQCITWQHSR